MKDFDQETTKPTFTNRGQKFKNRDRNKVMSNQDIRASLGNLKDRQRIQSASKYVNAGQRFAVKQNANYFSGHLNKKVENESNAYLTSA